jgi:predicted membrane chloride channel (bestrophin family)
MKERAAWTALVFEIRMLVVQCLLEFALCAAPKDRNERAKLAAALVPYLKVQMTS